MGARAWYYMDAAGTQVGPVEAADVRAAVLANAIGRDALAWHEGLPAWQPISQLRAALGLEDAAATPPPPPREYVIRSQVSEGHSLAEGAKAGVVAYVQANGTFPPDNAAARLADRVQGSYVSSVQVAQDPERLEVEFSAQSPQKANVAIDGKHLYLLASPAGDGGVSWTCVSDELKQKWCPSSCECTGSSGDRP